MCVCLSVCVCIYWRRFASHRRPPKFGDLGGRSANVESVMEQFLQKCWEQFELRFFWHWLDSRVARKIVDHILKTVCPKMYQKIIPKIIPKIAKNRRKLRSGGCFGRSGSLPGAMLTRLGCRSAKMHARCCQSCPIWCQLGGQVGAKILLKIYKKTLWFLCSFLELSWKRNWHRNHSKMEAEIDSKTLSRELGSESGESVILNNTTTF